MAMGTSGLRATVEIDGVKYGVTVEGAEETLPEDQAEAVADIVRSTIARHYTVKAVTE